jgi:hypothetical protein
MSFKQDCTEENVSTALSNMEGDSTKEHGMCIELFKAKNFDALLVPSNFKFVNALSYLGFLKESDEVIEKLILFCFPEGYAGKNVETYLKFLKCAIYGDRKCVFQILDKHGIVYEKVELAKIAQLQNADNCFGYFVSTEPAIEINIRTDVCANFPMKISRLHMLGTLANMIETKKNISSAHMKFFQQGRHLESHHTLFEENIQHDDFLLMKYM